MQGEYRGDFTRDTFDPLKRFTRVLMQQGRVQLDADWNEQVAILLHYLRALAVDIGGAYWGPAPNCGLEIIVDVTDPSERSRLEELKLLPLAPGDFLVAKGHYYVDGILCEKEEYTSYLNQSDLPGREPLANGSYLAYLDIWERHITFAQDDSIREVALGGPDAASRAQLVCQVKVEKDRTSCPNSEEWEGLVNMWQPKNRGQLKARAKKPQDATDPCITPPEARYRGAENQLYRVEIHRRGRLTDGDPPTFKWSRDNGSVVFPIRKLDGKIVTLEHLGRDTRFGLAVGDWVEITDDHYALSGEPGPLQKVDDVDRTEMTVTLASSPGVTYDETSETHPLLRRWDHKAGDPAEGGLELSDGAALIKESTGTAETDWLNLEDGVQIQFQPATAPEKHEYRTGDYWLIPARTVTGDVEWPGLPESPEARPPHGIEHHYAPIAIINVSGGTVSRTDCRQCVGPLGMAGAVEELRAPARRRGRDT